MREQGRILFGLCVTLGAVVLSGCGPSDSQQARQAAQTFVAACQDGDRAAIEATLTHAARERAGGTGLLLQNNVGNSESGYSLGEPEIEADTAIVPAVLTSGDKRTDVKIRLRREEKQWRVYAMTVPISPGGPQLTLDFEHPEAALADSFREMGRMAGTMAAGMAQAAQGFAQGFEESAQRAAEQTRKRGDVQPFPIIETTPPPGARP